MVKAPTILVTRLAALKIQQLQTLTVCTSFRYFFSVWKSYYLYILNPVVLDQCKSRSSSSREVKCPSFKYMECLFLSHRIMRP